MPKIKSKISTHNKKTLNKPVIQNIQKCKRKLPPRKHPVYSRNNL